MVHSVFLTMSNAGETVLQQNQYRKKGTETTEDPSCIFESACDDLI